MAVLSVVSSLAVACGGNTEDGPTAHTPSECSADADCTLHIDGCTGCIAVPPGYVPAACDQMIVQRCPDGAVARCVEGQCLVNGTCSESLPCPDTHYCDYGDDLCGRGLPTGTCTVRTTGCYTVLIPTCTCDGPTPVGNPCEAYRLGADVDAEALLSGNVCIAEP
jgi:hypothetical protein